MVPARIVIGDQAPHQGWRCGKTEGEDHDGRSHLGTVGKAQGFDRLLLRVTCPYPCCQRLDVFPPGLELRRWLRRSMTGAGANEPSEFQQEGRVGIYQAPVSSQDEQLSRMPFQQGRDQFTMIGAK